MYSNRKAFSIVEIIVSVVILSLFFTLAYKTIDHFSWIINYIDSNISWLNITKTWLDEVVKIRNNFFLNHPYDWWEEFVKKYGTWTFKLSKEKCNIDDELSNIYLCKIGDNKVEYEGPFDFEWNRINDYNGIYFYRKIDLDEDNKFYLKSLSRINSWTWDILVFNFTDSIYNQPNLLLSWEFENKNLSVEDSWLDIDYYNLNWDASDQKFDNLNNYNLRYSKILRYSTWSTISDGDFLMINWWEWSYKFLFYTDTLNITGTWVIPLKIYSDINKTYYDLCNEIDRLEHINCDFHFLIKDNFYQKMIWYEKDISNIDFWNNYSFSFSGWKQDSIVLYLSWGILPNNKTWLYINPYFEMKHNTDTWKINNFLSLISDSTAWLWVEIPDKPISLWWINTSSWFTSLYSVDVTTLLYDNNKYIDTFIISSKIWDINRYQDYYEEK